MYVDLPPMFGPVMIWNDDDSRTSLQALRARQRSVSQQRRSVATVKRSAALTGSRLR
jgi:hypothetical protein